MYDKYGQIICTCITGYEGDGTYCNKITTTTGTTTAYTTPAATTTTVPTTTAYTTTTKVLTTTTVVTTTIVDPTTTTPAPTTTTVDVCAVCHQNATCSIDSYGMVICECSEGFAGNGVNCSEITTTTTTTTTSTTTTSTTTYTTTTTTVKTTTTPATTITTVDRCAICHQNATCTMDSYGMIICECAEGFEGNGINCTEETTTTTSTTTTTTSTTVDLCAECHVNASCSTGQYGMILCQCDEGFEGDGKNCTEITTTTMATTTTLASTTTQCINTCMAPVIVNQTTTMTPPATTTTVAPATTTTNLCGNGTMECMMVCDNGDILLPGASDNRNCVMHCGCNISDKFTTTQAAPTTTTIAPTTTTTIASTTTTAAPDCRFCVLDCDRRGRNCDLVCNNITTTCPGVSECGGACPGNSTCHAGACKCDDGFVGQASCTLENNSIDCQLQQCTASLGGLNSETTTTTTLATTTIATTGADHCDCVVDCGQTRFFSSEPEVDLNVACNIVCTGPGCTTPTVPTTTSAPPTTTTVSTTTTTPGCSCEINCNKRMFESEPEIDLNTACQLECSGPACPTTVAPTTTTTVTTTTTTAGCSCEINCNKRMFESEPEIDLNAACELECSGPSCPTTAAPTPTTTTTVETTTVNPNCTCDLDCGLRTTIFKEEFKNCQVICTNCDIIPSPTTTTLATTTTVATTTTKAPTTTTTIEAQPETTEVPTTTDVFTTGPDTCTCGLDCGGSVITQRDNIAEKCQIVCNGPGCTEVRVYM